MRNLIVKTFIGCVFIGLPTFAACTALTAATRSNTAAVQPNHASSRTKVKTIVPAELKWNKAPNLTGVQNAVGVGDPTQPELYAMFGKMKKGAQFPAHSHPDARITTVVSGTMYYGVGKKFNAASLKPYPAGSVVYTPAGTSHFMWVRDGETIMQETGFGPTGLNITAKLR